MTPRRRNTVLTLAAIGMFLAGVAALGFWAIGKAVTQ